MHRFILALSCFLMMIAAPISDHHKLWDYVILSRQLNAFKILNVNAFKILNAYFWGRSLQYPTLVRNNSDII